MSISPEKRLTTYAQRLTRRLGVEVLSFRRANQLRASELNVAMLLDRLTQMVIDDCASHGVVAQSWKHGIRDEIHFWWHVIARQLSAKNPADNLAKYNESRKFRFPGLLSSLPTDINALDIGCALSPNIGNQHDSFRINVVAADPLASAYNILLDIHGIERNFSLNWCVAEKVADVFGEQSFDFILAENSLDHGIDPAISFLQVAKSLRKGGIARFYHWINEGEIQGYTGFHQWNINHDESNLVVWKPGVRHVLTPHRLGVSVDIVPFRKKKLNGREYDALEVTFRK